MSAENVPAASLHDTERAETEMRRADVLCCVECYRADYNDPNRVPAVLVVLGTSLCAEHARRSGAGVWS